MTINFPKLSPVLTAIFVLTGLGGSSQRSESGALLKNDDRFQKTIATNSVATVTTSGNTLNISVNSVARQLYKVENASAEGYLFRITTTTITDTIDVSGNTAIYRSDSLTDSSSIIEKAISKVMARTTLVRVNKKGVILSVTPHSSEHWPDSLTAFLDLFPDNFVPGDKCGLVSDLAFDTAFLKRFPKTDSLIMENSQSLITFSLIANEESTFSVRMTKTTTGNTANTNTNGIMLIDKDSGLAREISSKKVTAAEIPVGNVIYSVLRKSAVVESYERL